MPIIFSDHAQYQLKTRKIPKSAVIKAVQNPEVIFPSFRGRKLRRMKLNDKIIEVVTRTEGSRITIISAYYLDK